MKKPLVIAFGSQVKGRATKMSDFDFGVLEEKPLSLSRRADLSDYIGTRQNINEDKIDLVDLYSASPMLKFEVARTGRLIEGDTFDFVRFKVRSFKEYVDTAKFRRLREKVMMKKYA